MIEPNSTVWSEAAFYEAVQLRGLLPAPYTLDWSKLSAAGLFKPSQYDSERAVYLSASDDTFYLFMPTPELAKRVHYAVNFIKAACDRTAETGF